MEKTTLSQITEIKFRTTSILTYQKDRVSINERGLLEKLYGLMDDILLERVNHPRYSAEEYVDVTLIEYSILFRGSKNSEVKRLGKYIEKGLKW